MADENDRKLYADKQFCIKYVNEISRDDRIKLLQIIMLKIDPSIMSEQADGTRILLDKVDPIIISEIQNFIQNHI